MKLTLFQRFLLLVIMKCLSLSDISARRRDKLESLLCSVAFNGDLRESDFEYFR